MEIHKVVRRPSEGRGESLNASNTGPVVEASLGEGQYPTGVFLACLQVV